MFPNLIQLISKKRHLLQERALDCQKKEHYEHVVSLVLSCLDTNEKFLLDCTSSNRRKELQLIETLTYLTSAKARSTKLSSCIATVTKNVVLQKLEIPYLLNINVKHSFCVKFCLQMQFPEFFPSQGALWCNKC
jgi:hypothetical protein